MSLTVIENDVSPDYPKGNPSSISSVFPDIEHFAFALSGTPKLKLHETSP